MAVLGFAAFGAGDDGRESASSGQKAETISAEGKAAVKEDTEPGVAEAETAAIANAREALKKAALAVKVNESLTVADAIKQQPSLNAKIAAFVTEAKVGKKERMENDVHVVVVAPLTGDDGLVTIVLATLSAAGQATTVPAPPNAPAPPAPPAPPTAPTPPTFPPLNFPDTGPFTGLLIDARGLGVKSSVSPTIVDDAGKAVYGEMAALDQKKLDDIIANGIVGYLRSAEMIPKSRVGQRPLVIRGLAKCGDTEGSVKVSKEDAAKILDEDKKCGFLKKAAVVFLLQ